MTEAHDLAPGAMVTPSIRLVRMLGRGGMGSVWLAEHLKLHTQVVVKFMAAEYALNPEAMGRFEREASLAAQAKSPHVVQVFDHGVSGFGLPYIAMELLEGEDLAKRIERDRVIDPVVFAGWLGQACRGLSRAHGKGIVHRDIKPENIFLCENDGEVLVKVLDFGIAKAETGPSGFSGTRTGAFLGTAYYMSPEQTMGAKDLDHRSDLWALGVVSYFALTGVRPFDADALGPLVIAITSGAIPPPSSRNPALTPAIDAWMAKALARAREERFQSAKLMSEAFAQAIGVAAGAGVAVARGSSASITSPVQAVTAPTGGSLGASTMSPSVSNGSGPFADDAPAIPRNRTPWLVIAIALLGLIAGGAVLVVKFAGSKTAEESESDAPSATAPAAPPPPVPAAAPTPVLSPEPAPAPAPAPVVAPSATPAAASPRTPGKPAIKVEVAKPAPAVAVATPKPAPEPAKPAAVVEAKPVTAAPAKAAVAPKAAVAQPAQNPLKMKME